MKDEGGSSILHPSSFRRLAILSRMNGAWTNLDLAGKTADVYDLPAGQKPRYGVLHLHGLARQTLRDRPVFTRLFDELGLVCICPHGQRSWWTDRVCPEFDPKLTAEQH